MRRRDVGRMKRDPYTKITFREASHGDRGSLHEQVRASAAENGLVTAPTSVIGGGMLRCGMMPADRFLAVAKWHLLTLKEQDECVAVATFMDDVCGRLVEIEVRAPLGRCVEAANDDA
jgi:hypothetical protein